MRVFKSSYKDRKGKTVATATWYVEFVDHRGDARRVAGFSSKAATTELGRNLENLSAYARATGGQIDPALQNWVTELPRPLTVRLAAIGLLKSERVAVAKPLKEHVSDYSAALKARGNCKKHITHTQHRIERVIEGCGFKYWDDIAASRVQSFLGSLRNPKDDTDKGISAQTFNYYLGAMKSFCRWMVRERRAASTPLSHLEPLNTRVDRRYQRRALSAEELKRLLKAAKNGKDVSGTDRAGKASWRLTGSDRAVLYRLAVETGLRAGEIRSLTPASFNLAPSGPTVTVLAAYSKHRRDDTLPLTPGMVEVLREYFASRDPKAPLFDFPPREELAKVLRVDLEAAGIEHRDGQNRVVDFHALRHTFITNLAQGGVHPKTAQALARHSTITLTMDRYSHTGREQEVQALAALPDLSDYASDGKGANKDTDDGNQGLSVSADCLALSERPKASECDSGRLDGAQAARPQSTVIPGRNGTFQGTFKREKRDREIAIPKILNPLRLPFRHSGAEGDSRVDRAIVEVILSGVWERLGGVLGVVDSEQLGTVVANWPTCLAT